MFHYERTTKQLHNMLKDWKYEYFPNPQCKSRSPYWLAKTDFSPFHRAILVSLGKHPLTCC